MNANHHRTELFVVGATVALVTFAWQPWTVHGVEAKTAALVTATLVLVFLKVFQLCWAAAEDRRAELRALAPNSPAHLVLLAWLALGWVSLLWSAFPQVTLERNLEVTLLVVWAWLVMAVVRTADDFRLILWTYLICALGAAAVGLVGCALKATGVWARLFGAPGLPEVYFLTRVAVRPFGNPNLLAGYLLIPVGVAAGLSLQRDSSRRARWLAGAALALLLATVAAAGSLAGVVAAVVVLVLTGLVQLSPERRYRAVEVLVGLGVLAAFLGGQAVFRVGGEGLLAYSRGIGVRWFFWKWAGVLFLLRPVLGWGAGATFPTIMPVSNLDRLSHPGLFAPKLVHCHNEFLEVGVEMGLLGLALFLAVLYLAARPLGRAYLRQGRGQLSAAAVGLFAGFLGLNVQACFSVAPRFVEVACFYWLALGLMLAWQRPAIWRDSAEVHPGAPGAGRWKPTAGPGALVLIALLVCGWLCYEVAWLPLRSAWYLRGGLRAGSQGRTSVAREMYERAAGGRLPYVDQIKLLTEMGLVEERAGRYERALTYYGVAMKMAPGVSPLEAAARAMLAIREAERGNLEKAIGHGQEAVRLDPDRPAYHARLAEWLFQAGRRAEAEEVIEWAAERFADDAGSLKHLRELRQRYRPTESGRGGGGQED